jgi:hypothetical protein
VAGKLCSRWHQAEQEEHKLPDRALCCLAVQNAGNNSKLTCTVQLNITADMQGPVYVYYELNGFYQNHRRYVMGHQSPPSQQYCGFGRHLANDSC